MSTDDSCISPVAVSNDLNYFNTNYKALEDALIRPKGSVQNSPFVKYVTQLLIEDAASNNGKRTPVIMSKGFYYYLLDLNALPVSGKVGADFYYHKRHIFAQSETFGSLTAVSHAIPALFAIKELSGSVTDNISNIKSALEGLSANLGDLTVWRETNAWSDHNADRISPYIQSTVKTLSTHVSDWSASNTIPTADWNEFAQAIHKPMINTFFLALLSEAHQLFELIQRWKNEEDLSDFDWEKVICAISFSSDNPLSGKPGSDFSLETSAEYFLMRAFLNKTFNVELNEIDTTDPYAKFSGASIGFPTRIFTFPTAVPGWPDSACPSASVDKTVGDINNPNSVIMGSAVSSLYWATIAQRNMAKGLFPTAMGMPSDANSTGFYDLLTRSQYGLRYTLVRSIAEYFIANGSVTDMPCPYPEHLW